jgi:hypothetical protein
MEFREPFPGRLSLRGMGRTLEVLFLRVMARLLDTVRSD